MTNIFKSVGMDAYLQGFKASGTIVLSFLVFPKFLVSYN